MRIVITGVLLTLLFLPVFLYLINGWKAKRAELVNYFKSEESVESYFDQFPPTESVSDAKALSSFTHMYDRTMSRQKFILPFSILALIALFETWAATGKSLQMIGFLKLNEEIVLPDIALAAVAGAYMWVTFDFIQRHRRRDFTPSDLLMASLRLAMAIPLGYAFSTVAAKDIGPLIAFAIGAFPLEPLKVFLRRLALKRLNIEDKGDEAKGQVMNLEGINKDISERLGQCGIFTISQLSQVDPVMLTQRTNLSFNFILDCISQALAWNYFEEKLNLLRPYGLRGAHEIANFIEDIDNGTTEEKGRATAALAQISDALSMSEDALQTPFREISKDPYTIFIHEIYS